MVIARDGTVIATLNSSETTYTDTGLAAGDYEYCLTMTIGDGTSPTVCGFIHVLANPSDLSCVSAAGFVNLSWTNNDAYDNLVIERDGTLLAILSGTDTSTLTAAPRWACVPTPSVVRPRPASAEMTVHRGRHFLTAPGNLGCSVTAGEADLSWTNGDTYEHRRQPRWHPSRDSWGMPPAP